MINDFILYYQIIYWYLHPAGAAVGVVDAGGAVDVVVVVPAK